MKASSKPLFHRLRSFLPAQFSSHLPLNELDKQDTTVLKGLAILAILFHNFFHVFGNVHENEFDFDAGRFPVFLHTVVHPSLTIQALFAFFGHFGVQVFIFLSAYGLAKSHWNDDSSWSSFMWSRIKKLYPIFLTVVSLWAILAGFDQGMSYLFHDVGLGLLLMFAGISTFVPGMGLPPIGPWWFIPFIMQFYAIWPIVRKIAKKFGWHGLLALALICFMFTQVTNPLLKTWDINLAESPLGRMRVFCLGILAARYPFRLNAYVAGVALSLVVLGNAYYPLAPLASLSATIFAIWLYTRFRTPLRNIPFLNTVGKYSLAIFLTNGIVRTAFVPFATTPAMQLLMAGASFLVTFGISFVLQDFLFFEAEPKTIAAPVVSETASPLAVSASAPATDPR